MQMQNEILNQALHQRKRQGHAHLDMAVGLPMAVELMIFWKAPKKPRRCAKWLNSFRGAQSGFSTSMASPFQWIL
ncbi:hypothetical protein DAI18_08745 [Microvirgula aerodenitrificans]|uniref:Uncharacterized protein n=1 Tax=Microvirgula aerodenitrificans TaxID=57480 RepID=A0A2S0P9P8_9NEIS|nr:hypothetical protein DAI18_08745 [Microvirgula aerodenitrificans]